MDPRSGPGYTRAYPLGQVPVPLAGYLCKDCVNLIMEWYRFTDIVSYYILYQDLICTTDFAPFFVHFCVFFFVFIGILTTRFMVQFYVL